MTSLATTPTRASASKLIQELECPVVKGNHDEQASIVASTEAFNELAEEAIDWTRAQLSAADIAWLADLA